MSTAKMRAQLMRFIHAIFGNGETASLHDEVERLRWLQNRNNCLLHQISVTLFDESGSGPDSPADRSRSARLKTSQQRQALGQADAAGQNGFEMEQLDMALVIDGEHLQPEHELSPSAQEEVARLEMAKREQVARSFGTSWLGQDPRDTYLVDEWNCSGTSFLGIGSTLELSPVEKVEQGGSSDDVAEGMEAAAATEQPAPRKPSFNVPGNPYRHYSDTALMLLAQNPSTQRNALIWLSFHPSPDIRNAVARNRYCPMEALALMAKDAEAGIRHAVADNPRSSIGILEYLAVDKNPLIAWRAQNNLNVARGRRTVTDLKPTSKKQASKPEPVRSSPQLPYSEQLAATEETINFLRLIAQKSSTPVRRLSELARHPDARVRASVAENANTPLELIWLLARDQDQEVRLTVIENYNCPVEILEALKDDSDPYVSWQARSVLYRLTNPGEPNPFTDHKKPAANNTMQLPSLESGDPP